jgi:hypothetical protein
MKWFLALATLAEALPQVGRQGAGAGSGSGGYSLLRFGCAEVSVQRIDPYVNPSSKEIMEQLTNLIIYSLVNPGQVPSSHMHQIVGGVSQTQDAKDCRTGENGDLRNGPFNIERVQRLDALDRYLPVGDVHDLLLRR